MNNNNENNNIKNLKENQFLIDSFSDGQRFDKFLLKYFNTAKKSFVYKMLRLKRIKLNGKKADGNEILKSGDVITFYISPETMNEFMEAKEIKSPRTTFELDIVFEDENILICNKPQGLLSHAETIGDDTIIDRILFYLNEKGEYIPSKTSVFTPALANRLDRNTSGLIVCGKNLHALQALNHAIKERKIERNYLAVVNGKVTEKMTLSSFAIKDENKNKMTLVESSENAKDMETHIYPLQTNNRFSLVKASLITGRTHQIRVQLSNAGFPIIGDAKYGNPEINRKVKSEFGIDNILLHSYEIIFNEKDGFLSYLQGKRFVYEPDKMFSNDKNPYTLAN